MSRPARLAALCALALATLPAPAAAQPHREPPPASAAPAKRAAQTARPGSAQRAERPAPVSAAPTVSWHDGERRRELQVDPAQVADFRAAPAGKFAALRARTESEKTASALPDGISPVFVDPAAPSQVRALPGGVIVTLRHSPAGNDALAREAEGRRQIAAAGLHALRPIGPDARRWLVASPAGMPALELANRLHASSDFESATPNWWKPRALK